MTAYELVNIALKEVGTTENPPNSNKVLYNNWFYGHEVSGPAYPWCATFVSWCFRSEPSILKKSASCTTILNDCRSKGMLVSTPQIGDIVFFNFSNAKQTSKAEHIGIVVDVQSDKVITVEGNTSFDDKGSQDNGGAVARRKRTRSMIAFARPKYEGNTSTKLTNEEVARLVLKGKYGCGNVRKQKLESEGYNYKEVQAIVNQLLRG